MSDPDRDEAAHEIRALDADTIDRIAAGEVVERPASVVKELVENAIDADATRITVEVDSGGIDRIRVVDNGIGMGESAVRKAVEPHTTSKLRDIEELAEGVDTLGFRGEALHTIGAVSRMAITTKPAGADGAGTKLVMQGGDVLTVEPVGCPPGTAVEVTELFSNTPARKKFLKQEPTEFDHVNRIVTRYALANPATSVALEHNDRQVFRTPGQGDLESTILAVYGRDVADALVSLDEATLPDGPIDEIGGAVTESETTRSSPRYIATFVNGRAVHSGILREAIAEAYGHGLAGDRYPFAVVHLTMPGDSVDVNVHPRKLEVKFDREDAVRRQVRQAVQSRLQATATIRSTAPRGRSAPEETPVDPAPAASDQLPTVSSEAEGEPEVDDDARRPASGQPSAGDAGPATDTGTTAGSTSAGGSGADTDTDTDTDIDTNANANAAGDPGPAPKGDRACRSQSISSTTLDTPTSLSATPQGASTGEAGQTHLGREPEPTFDRLPDLRVLGQVAETFIVAEAEGGLLLIDQHAADERVQFERLRDRFSGDITTQTLVEPATIELTAGEAAIYDMVAGALDHLGFRASRSGTSLSIHSVPAILGGSFDPETFRTVLEATVDGDPRETIEETADALLADLACYPAITGNESLTEGSIASLLDALDSCEDPLSCPHGRPTVIRLGWDEIEGRFERDYPGHSG